MGQNVIQKLENAIAQLVLLEINAKNLVPMARMGRTAKIFVSVKAINAILRLDNAFVRHIQVEMIARKIVLTASLDQIVC